MGDKNDHESSRFKESRREGEMMRCTFGGNWSSLFDDSSGLFSVLKPSQEVTLLVYSGNTRNSRALLTLSTGKSDPIDAKESYAPDSSCSPIGGSAAYTAVGAIVPNCITTEGWMVKSSSLAKAATVPPHKVATFDSYGNPHSRQYPV